MKSQETYSFQKGLHDDACRILEEIGIKCSNKGNLQQVIEDFESTGLAAYDSNTGRLHILKDIVDRALESVPKRDKFPIPNNSFGGGGTASFVVQGDDYVVPYTKIHVADILRTAEEFKIPFMFKGVSSEPSGFEDVHQIDVMREHYSGYIYANVGTKEGVERCKRDHQIWDRIATTHSILKSPLEFNDVRNNINIFYKCIKAKLPIYHTTMPISCMTAPATMYGLVTQAHAEFLTALTLSQTIREGTRVINGAFPSAGNPVNMETQPLGSKFHNLANYLESTVSAALDIPSIQSGCTISTKYHDPLPGGTDKETENGYKLWNSLDGWHQVRHSFGFVNQLTAYDINKMRRDIKCLNRVRDKNETIDINYTDMWHDNQAINTIQQAVSRGGMFKDLDHTRGQIENLMASYSK